MPKKINRVGRKYGKLTVVSESPIRRHLKVTWNCECECGKEKLATSGDLQTGKVVSCGAYECKVYNVAKAHEARLTHGMSNTRVYGIWAGMKLRCNNGHPNYGGKGISYCEEWENFENFLAWSDSCGYCDTLTLDRIDSTKDYGPNNCRWLSRKGQARNRSTNVMIEYNNQVKCVAGWAEHFDICIQTLRDRLNRGWSLKRAFETKGGSYER